ncbi:MFS transporter [Clostridium thermobutyricum]|uniref:Inner membrane transport protein YajR n=1 Tax=Clostridium thermobutyricum DSM 4928 TaxID=1121339 RepID=A0A1V4STY0_9CLOT|nr:MFS transporter [Clostridium thermobutyricum]OPX47347.1 inner membrane transport protein YajR [Clostridium thermobutyricum DSM 4928]
MSKSKIKKENLILVIVIALALGSRQLAMNIVTPFVAYYAQTLLFGSLVLGGIALGIFNLTQGFCQVPFGNLYDKIGGKKVVLIGLGALICGLFLSFISNNAYVYVLSRALQGSGAITSAAYSWLSKSVSPEERADSISLVGVVVGLASAIALGGGPVLIKFISVKTLYLASTIIVSLVFLFVLFFVKSDVVENTKKEKIEGKGIYLKKIFKDKKFISYLIIAFSANYIGIASFFLIPEYLKLSIGIDSMWKVLTPAILIAIVIMRISTKFIKKGYVKRVAFLAGIGTIIAGLLLLTESRNLLLLLIESILVFGAYTVVTALIPTVINDFVDDKFRGLVNGIANGCSYLGSFLGATISGLLFSNNLIIALIIILVIGIVFTCTTLIMSNGKKVGV